jgi:hypothetical protein
MRNKSAVPWNWKSGVYFIEQASLIKIGWSFDVKVRAHAIKLSKKPLPIKPLGFIRCPDEETAVRLERDLHIAQRAEQWPAPKPKSR